MKSVACLFGSLLLPFLAACMNETDGAPAPIVQPDAGDAALPEKVSFRVKLVDATTPDTALAGVEVCAADRPEIACAKSDASGAIALTLPARSELMLRCASDTHAVMYMTWNIGNADIDAGTFSLLSKSTAELLVRLSGGTPSADKGVVLVNVYDELVKRTTRVAGLSFSIAPKTGGGPTYLNESRSPDSSLTATSTGGPAVFFDLAPGEVTITASRACAGGLGWKTDDAKAQRTRVFGGGISSVTFACPN